MHNKKHITGLNSKDESYKLDKCIVCGGGPLNPLYSGILKCHDCGHVFADCHISEEEISAFYDRSYFFGSEYGNYLAAKGALQKNFRSRLRVIKKFADPERHSNLFEIGCAYGFFLDIARDSFDIVSGMDITEDGVQYACEQLKLEVIQADFLRYDFGDKKFDVVCMWDTIEHLRSPHLYIEKVSAQMDGGALLAKRSN